MSRDVPSAAVISVGTEALSGSATGWIFSGAGVALSRKATARAPTSSSAPARATCQRSSTARDRQAPRESLCPSVSRTRRAERGISDSSSSMASNLYRGSCVLTCAIGRSMPLRWNRCTSPRRSIARRVVRCHWPPLCRPLPFRRGRFVSRSPTDATWLAFTAGRHAATGTSRNGSMTARGKPW